MVSQQEIGEITWPAARDDVMAATCVLEPRRGKTGGQPDNPQKNGYIIAPCPSFVRSALLFRPRLTVPRMQSPATLLRHLLFLSLVLAVAAQHDHGHSHHGVAKSEWDEEEYLRSNPPTPPSYWSEDTRMRMSPDEELPPRHPWLMVLHVLFMSGAFFVALPAGECFSHPALLLTLPRVPEVPVLTECPVGDPRFPHPHAPRFPFTVPTLPLEPDRITHSYLVYYCLGIALRSVKSSFHALSVVAFYGLVTLGLSSSALYRKLSPDL